MASAATAAMPQCAASSSISTTMATARTKLVLTIDACNLTKPTTPPFEVPTILITPPDAPPRYSSAIPEQQYEKTVLFVPVKTEELGWDEHGLYWNGTYAYPVHQIYDKEGQPIGRRRKGPHGYRFEEFYDNKKPRRCSQPSTSDDVVEEASVRLEEPAPARIERISDKAAGSTGSEQPEQTEKSSSDAIIEEDTDMVPASPTLSVASSSDVTETEDSSSFYGDDTNSLWSRADDEDFDDEQSNCTSPGVMSPTLMDVDTKPEGLKPETLSKKLSDLTDNKVNKNTWLSLGTLPSSSSPSASSSRSQSLPTTAAARRLTVAKEHRASSTPIFEQRRHSSPSAYTSIIQDLTTSPFAAAASPSSASASASASASTSAFGGSGAKSPFRSATLPRSTSRSAYSNQKYHGSVLRPPPQYASCSSSSGGSHSSGRRSSSSSYRSSPLANASGTGSGSLRTKVGGADDFSAGWSFEDNSALLDSSNHSFASYY